MANLDAEYVDAVVVESLKKEIADASLSLKMKDYLLFMLNGMFYKYFMINMDNIPVRERKKVREDSRDLITSLLRNDEKAVFKSFWMMSYTSFKFFDENIDDSIELIIECVKYNLDKFILKRYNNNDDFDDIAFLCDIGLKADDIFKDYFEDVDVIDKQGLKGFLKAHYTINHYFIVKDREITKESIDEIIEAFDKLGCDELFLEKLRGKIDVISILNVKNVGCKFVEKTPVNSESIRAMFKIPSKPVNVKKITFEEHKLLKLINNDRDAMMPNRYLNLEEIIEYVSLMIYCKWYSSEITKFLKNCKKKANLLRKANGVSLSAFDMITLEKEKLEYYSRSSEELADVYNEMMECYELYKLLMEDSYCLDSKLQELEEQYKNEGDLEMIVEQYSKFRKSWIVGTEMNRFVSGYSEYSQLLEEAYKNYMSLIPCDFDDLYEVVVAKARVLEKKEEK